MRDKTTYLSTAFFWSFEYTTLLTLSGVNLENCFLPLETFIGDNAWSPLFISYNCMPHYYLNNTMDFAKPEIQCSTHKRSSIISTWRRINPFSFIDIYLFETNSNFILPSNLGLAKDLFLIGLHVKIWKHTYLLPFWLYPAHCHILDLITLPKLRERYELHINILIVKPSLLSILMLFGFKY